jgi:hypothetical protein
MRPRGRRAAGPRPRKWLLLLALLTVGGVGAAQQISYTVQVVALSDPEAGLQIVGDLLRQGFPSYMVRSTSTQGAVYRVRVGAFANRQAAQLYAEAMPPVAGGQPVPALAEGIPEGVTPLAPRLVLSQSVQGLESRLLLVGQKLALRTQKRAPLEVAEYAILSQGNLERVRAWQLAEEPDGTRILVRDMVLWPESWREDSPAVLEGYKSALIGLVAERLGLDTATVEAAQYGQATGVPRLVVVERAVPGVTDGPELLGLGLPASGMTPAGPLAFLVVDEELLPGLPEGVRLDLIAGSAQGQLPLPASAQEPAAPAEPEEAADDEAAAPTGEEPQPEAPAGPQRFEGNGWTATADGPFVRLQVPPSIEGATATSWRAALGAPLFSSGDYLVAQLGTALLIYDFLPRR